MLTNFEVRDSLQRQVVCSPTAQIVRVRLDAEASGPGAGAGDVDQRWERLC